MVLRMTSVNWRPSYSPTGHSGPEPMVLMGDSDVQIQGGLTKEWEVLGPHVYGKSAVIAKKGEYSNPA